MKLAKKENKLFAIAADDWRNDVMDLRKFGSHKRYNILVRKLVLEFGDKRVNSIDKHTLQRFIQRMNQTSGVDNIKQHLNVFKGIMEYADDDFQMPRLKLPKREKPKQEIYTFEETRKLLRNSSGKDRVLIMLLAETGCRIGEALALTENDVKETHISITKNVYNGVLQSSPKTQSSIRNTSISETLYSELKRIFPVKGFIFKTEAGNPEWSQNFGIRLKEICRKSGVEYKGCHAFRRGNVTELILKIKIPERIVGMRVGHLSDSITLGVYCKPQVGDDDEWVPVIEKYLYKGELGSE